MNDSDLSAVAFASIGTVQEQSRAGRKEMRSQLLAGKLWNQLSESGMIMQWVRSLHFDDDSMQEKAYREYVQHI